MNTNLTIHPVETDEQMRDVAELAHAIWNHHYVPIIGQEQVDYMLERLQSSEAIRIQIAEGQEYYLATANGIPAGYLGLIPQVQEGRLMISKLYVRDSRRGCGIGIRLLDLSIQRAEKLHIKEIYLRVNRHNCATMTWYRKRGFTVAETIRSDIGGGFYMDDFIMEYRLGE